MLKSTLLALFVLRQFNKTQRKVVIPADVVNNIVDQAMGYAWEIGAGKPLTEVLDASPSNPFLSADWRKDVA